jgi:hypothetical protein
MIRSAEEWLLDGAGGSFKGFFKGFFKDFILENCG